MFSEICSWLYFVIPLGPALPHFQHASFQHVSLIKAVAPVLMANLSAICKTWCCHYRRNCCSDMCPWSTQSRFQNFQYTVYCSEHEATCNLHILRCIYAELLWTLPVSFYSASPEFQCLVVVLTLTLERSKLTLNSSDTCWFWGLTKWTCDSIWNMVC